MQRRLKLVSEPFYFFVLVLSKAAKRAVGALSRRGHSASRQADISTRVHLLRLILSLNRTDSILRNSMEAPLKHALRWLTRIGTVTNSQRY